MSDDAMILVVDDDARLRGLLSRYLADNGFRVAIAQDAAEARDQMRFLQPDLRVGLARRANEILSREDIAEALHMDEAGERAIDVQMTRLRRKIEADPRDPRYLHTVRGRGYTLKPGADPS